MFGDKLVNQVQGDASVAARRAGWGLSLGEVEIIAKTMQDQAQQVMSKMQSAQ